MNAAAAITRERPLSLSVLRGAREVSSFAVVHRIDQRRVFCPRPSMERSDADEPEAPFRWKNVVRCKRDVHPRFVVLRPISSSNILSNNSSEKISFVLILRVFFVLLQNRGEKTNETRWSVLADVE